MSVASSSSHTHSPLSKRSRLDSEVADDLEVDGEMDDATKAKVARKEARVIRNRESAQRSRNQRKQYLANLEVRNRELEEEVRRLRGDSNSSTTATSTSSASVTPPRETSPEQTVLSFAGELGIPPQMVSSGVSLSAVAPPPSDAEVAVKQEPVSGPAPSTTTSHVDVEQLVAQNTALTQRVTMLENLLKQVVAVSNFGGLAPPPSEPNLPIHHPEPPAVEDDNFDISSFIQSTHTEDAPVTPTIFPVQSNPNSSASSFHPVACHSAAVATFVLSSAPALDEGKAQQRARGTGMEMSLDSRLITTERLDKGLDQTNEIYNGLGLDFGVPDAQTQAQRSQVETWDEGMSTLLANLEGRVSVEQGLGMGMGIGQGEVWNTDSWTWESVPV